MVRKATQEGTALFLDLKCSCVTVASHKPLQNLLSFNETGFFMQISNNFVWSLYWSPSRQRTNSLLIITISMERGGWADKNRDNKVNQKNLWPLSKLLQKFNSTSVDIMDNVRIYHLQLIRISAWTKCPYFLSSQLNPIENVFAILKWRFNSINSQEQNINIELNLIRNCHLITLIKFFFMKLLIIVV